ncbi:MAG: DEAD/DEAH box helicase, partial [Dehalococcoidia bacterium]|nr:DEAD/DEAH box helicase [Dehalococcoidia bacterium]
MTADLGRLRGVLEEELEGGCPDTSVEGGLDGLLREQARGEQPRSALLRMVGALPPEGYRSLDAEARRKWARRAIATIAAEEAAPSKRASKPRAKSRAAPSKRAAVAQPAKRTAPAPKIPPGAAALEVPLRDARTGLRGATFDRLERLGLRTVGDAMRHYPRRHNDFSRTVPISELLPGEEQTIRGTIDRAREIRMGRGGRMRSTEVQVTDEAGARIRVLWFNQPYLARTMREGAQIAVSGLVRAYRNRPTFQNPEFELLSEANGGRTHTGRLVPMYPLTERLAQRTLRTLIASMLEQFADRLPETLPEEVRARHGLLGIVEATRQVHYPDDQPALQEALRRLAFDELLAIQLGVVRRKREWQETGDAPAIVDRSTAEAFIAGLPFELTGAQRRALNDVLGDIAQTVPMARLMEGDVGSGKTVVALAAMLSAVASGRQAVLMAPTEVLAEQHFRTICSLLSGDGLSGDSGSPLHGLLPVPYLPLPLRAVLLTGSTRAKERRDAIGAIAQGAAQIIVGTHALIEEAVEYERLGLT